MAATRLVFPAPRGQHPARQPRPRSHPARWRPARPARGAAAAAAGPVALGHDDVLPAERGEALGAGFRRLERQPGAVNRGLRARSHRLTRSVVGDHEECNRECGLRGSTHSTHHRCPPTCRASSAPWRPWQRTHSTRYCWSERAAEHERHRVVGAQPVRGSPSGQACHSRAPRPLAGAVLGDGSGTVAPVRMASYFRRSAPRSRSLRSKPIDCPAGRTAKL